MRGGQRQALLLVQNLASRGDEVSVLARRGSPFYQHVKAAGLRVLDATLLNLYGESKSVDIVHAHDARAHLLASIASQKPFVVGRRVAFPIHTSFLSVWKYRRAAAYLAVSRAVAAQLQRAHILPAKIHLVHDAVLPAECSWAWMPGAPVVTFASDDPSKGTDLIRAAAPLWGSAPLVLSSNLANDLLHAAVFLYITRSEGLGSAALLAMSMGVPVIASATGGLLEIFEHRKSGLHVANEPEVIAAAVRRVTSEKQLAERLSRSGYARVRAQFNVEAMVDKTLAAYRSVL